MADFFDNSAQLMLMKRGGSAKENYPWVELPVGKSFGVDKNRIKFSSLRTLASRMGAKLKRRFRVCEHEKAYEVGRLSDKSEKVENRPVTWNGLKPDDLK